MTYLKELLAPISIPSKGVAGRTGFWRTFKPIINRDRCTKCLLCWLYCPEGAIIRTEDDSVFVDYDYCKGCGICANECPRKAIKMILEE